MRPNVLAVLEGHVRLFVTTLIAAVTGRRRTPAALALQQLRCVRGLGLRALRRAARIVGPRRNSEFHATPTIRGRCRSALGLKVLGSGSCRDQHAIPAQMFGGQQTVLQCRRNDGVEKALRRICLHKPHAQACEVRLVESRFLQVRDQERLEQDALVEHLANQSIRAPRVQSDKHLWLERRLRRDSGSSGVCVQRLNLPRQSLKNQVSVCNDATQPMIYWSLRLWRGEAEYLRLRVSLSTHPLMLHAAQMRPILAADNLTDTHNHGFCIDSKEP